MDFNRRIDETLSIILQVLKHQVTWLWLPLHSIESTGIIKLHAHRKQKKKTIHSLLKNIYIISIEDANNIVSNELKKYKKISTSATAAEALKKKIHYIFLLLLNAKKISTCIHMHIHESISIYKEYILWLPRWRVNLLLQ